MTPKQIYMRQWRKDNAEKLRAQDRARHARNREQRNAKVRAWRKRNPGYAKAWHARQRQKEAELNARIAALPAVSLDLAQVRQSSDS